MAKGHLVADRRTFLFGLGATLVAVPKLQVSRIPVIHGDGIEDDWEGIDALLNGRPVKLPTGDTFAPGDRPVLSGGAYRISKPILATVPFTLTRAVIISPAFELPRPEPALRNHWPKSKPAISYGRRHAFGVSAPTKPLRETEEWETLLLPRPYPERPEWPSDTALFDCTRCAAPNLVMREVCMLPWEADADDAVAKFQRRLAGEYQKPLSLGHAHA